MNVTLGQDWKGHDAGQFASVTFDPKEGKHPFTIASAWDANTRKILFITKGLGDYTKFLPETLHPGGEAIVEGPYFKLLDAGAPCAGGKGSGMGLARD